MNEVNQKTLFSSVLNEFTQRISKRSLVIIFSDLQGNQDEIDELRANYMALLCLCDELLGEVLDYFDRFELWRDTALIVATDHGFLLGEHDWWAKNRMPLFEEISHIPLFIYHPEYSEYQGQRRKSLTQTIDLMPTILDCLLYTSDAADE